MIYSLLRRLLFLLPAEIAHSFTLKSLALLHRAQLRRLPLDNQLTETSVFGLRFANKVGIAAGLDKNGAYLDALANLGCGFIEVGTVTPKPQAGNKKPRLFRIPSAQALINRMGFNNHGVDRLITNIQQAKYRGILGINIGKNATTPLENAGDDYVLCLQKVYAYASYITINISSPNTPGLRQLQQASDLDKLLGRLKKAQAECAAQHKKYVPLLVKISPDLNTEELADIAGILLAHTMDGIIATNTTLAREIESNLPHANETGGLSGQPLFNRSLQIVQQLQALLAGKIPIIACGGISSVEQAKAMYDAGAALIQIYTGLIYQGPALIKALRVV